MGGEFGQWREWNHDESLDWNLLEYAPHQGLQKWVQDVNRLYRSEPALHELDFDQTGFEWIDCNDGASSTLSFIRKAKSTEDIVLVACNFTPVARSGYRLGVPRGGLWKEILNGDSPDYGGSGQGNFGGLQAEPVPSHSRPHSLSLTLPPLAALFFKGEARG